MMAKYSINYMFLTVLAKVFSLSSMSGTKIEALIKLMIWKKSFSMLLWSRTKDNVY